MILKTVREYVVITSKVRNIKIATDFSIIIIKFRIQRNIIISSKIIIVKIWKNNNFQSECIERNSHIHVYEQNGNTIEKKILRPNQQKDIYIRTDILMAIKI